MGEEKDWVTSRLNCKPKVIFRALLEQVKRDIDRINKAPETDRYERSFSVYPAEDGTTFDVRFGLQGRVATCASFSASTKEIRIVVNRDITIGRSTQINVKYEWEPKTLTCILSIDSGPVELWEISQKALYDWFFEADPADVG